MTEEKFIQLNIAFRIPKEVARVAMKLSGEISEKEDVYFVLDGIEYFPHVTIYQPEFPEKNVDKIIEAVENIAKDFFPVVLEYADVTTERGWIGIDVKKTKEIEGIHKKVIEKLNPLREDHLKDKYKSLDKCQMISEEQHENILNYGYSALMNSYQPHLTINRLKDNDIAEKVANKIEWKIKEFKVDTVGVFISGEHGTCRKLIREFKLGK